MTGGWDLRSQKSTPFHVVLSASCVWVRYRLSAAAAAPCLPPAIFPAIMAMHSSPETVSQPPVKCFLF